MGVNNYIGGIFRLVASSPNDVRNRMTILIWPQERISILKGTTRASGIASEVPLISCVDLSQLSHRFALSACQEEDKEACVSTLCSLHV